jgi:hypothetical protein
MGDSMGLLCMDYERAATNRDMVRLKQNITGYLEIEQMARNWPRKKLLPEQLLGHLPSISDHESRTLGEYGIHEVDND